LPIGGSGARQPPPYDTIPPHYEYDQLPSPVPATASPPPPAPPAPPLPPDNRRPNGGGGGGTALTSPPPAATAAGQSGRGAPASGRPTRPPMPADQLLDELARRQRRGRDVDDGSVSATFSPAMNGGHYTTSCFTACLV